MAREDRAELGPVSDEGAEVTRRRERLGLDMYELAGEAGVSRHTVAAIEHGKGFRRTSLAKIENALDRIEAEVGLDAPPREEPVPFVERRRTPPSTVTITVRPDGEVVIEAQGTIDPAALRELAAGLLADIPQRADSEDS